MNTGPLLRIAAMKVELISAPSVGATAVTVSAGVDLAVGAVGAGLPPPHDDRAKTAARKAQPENLFMRHQTWPT